MGIIRKIEERARLESPKVPLSTANVGSVLGLTQQSSSGVNVTPDTAMGLTAFWAGIRMISQAAGQTPIEVYERVGDFQRKRRRDHPVDRLLTKRPNPHMTPFTFKEMRLAHCLTWGNSYAEIERDKAGRPIALWPLLPDRTGVEIKNGEKRFWTEIDGIRIWLAADRVLHVPGLGFDGLRGYNVVKIHRDSLGLTIAANEYGGQLFKNSARPSGVIKHPGTPEGPERQEIRDEWNQIHSGLTKAQRTAVLWGGMEWQQISIAPEDAQFLQTRGMQIEEVARILNINPILLQHHEKATTWGTGVGQFLLAHSKFTITPWFEREEDVLNWDLFSESERENLYVKYNEKALTRGDPKTQAEILEIKRRNGIINADEWRALDDENPLPDGLGQEYVLPLNYMFMSQMAEIGNTATTASQKGQEDDEGDGQEGEGEEESKNRMKITRQQRSITMRRRLRQAHLAAFQDGARRYVKRDTDALKKAIRKAFESGGDPAESLKRWIEDFYPGQEQYIYRTMLPIVTALAAVVAAEAADEVASEPEGIDTFAAEYTENLARREAGSSRGQLLALLKTASEEDLQEALTARAAEWADKRPAKIAADEVVRVSSGAARFAWGAAGVSYLVWRANPGACPLCQEMDGKRVGIKEYFLTPGESVTSEDRPGGISAGANIAGPPLHEGCQCDLVPD